MVSKTAKFLRKSRSEKWLIFKITAMLCLLVFLINYIPLRWWRGNFDFEKETANPAPHPANAEHIARAREIGMTIRMVSKHLPFTILCLPQAIAAQWVLRKEGIDNKLYIGARKGEEKPFEFHAWLLVGQLCVTGRQQYEQFSSFVKKSSANNLENGN